jgi:ABC-type branched-subunit amino acid transport system permease subunit
MGNDEDAANSSGINAAKHKMIVFFISSFLAGLAGGIFDFYRGAVVPAQQFARMSC